MHDGSAWLGWRGAASCDFVQVREMIQHGRSTRGCRAMPGWFACGEVVGGSGVGLAFKQGVLRRVRRVFLWRHADVGWSWRGWKRRQTQSPVRGLLRAIGASLCQHREVRLWACWLGKLDRTRTEWALVTVCIVSGAGRARWRYMRAAAGRARPWAGEWLRRVRPGCNIIR